MPSTEQHLIAMANAIMCAVSWFICVCRLNSMSRSRSGGTNTGRRVRWLVVAEYAVGAGAMMFSAFRPLINEWPGYASLVVACYVLLALLASGKAWRDPHSGGERPPFSATKPTDLHHEPAPTH